MSTPPAFLPVLSSGSHRSPRRGACFMEFASLLAGERWSDHPRCTHPVLAALARSVNDCTSDDARPQLAPLIPAVIGTADDDPRIPPRLAMLSCRTALPYAQGQARLVLAVALLSAQRFLAREEGRDLDLSAGLRELRMSGQEAAWAEAFLRGLRPSRRYYLRRGARRAVEYAAFVMASTPGPATDEALRGLLAAAIDLHREIAGGDGDRTPREVGDESWAAACAAVGGSARRS